MVGRGRKLWRTTYVKLRRFGSEPILDRFWTDAGPGRGVDTPYAILRKKSEGTSKTVE